MSRRANAVAKDDRRSAQVAGELGAQDIAQDGREGQD